MTPGPPRPPSDPSVAPATASIVPPAPDAGTVAPKDAPTVKPAPSPAPPHSGFRPRLEQLPVNFGRYRVTKLLGEGGMGAVYLAHDSQLDRPVALKVPQFDAGDGPLMRERFLREARAAATLQHANICPVYDVGEIDGASYMTMAFIEGRSLAEVLRDQVRVDSRTIALLLRKIALALHQAHRKQVVHRDLKPGNIMLTEKNEPVVMDFGLARRGGADARITRAGDIMGTPAYMAPEQASGIQEKIGPQCDVYSLGVILYEMLCGQVPFAGDTMAVLTQVLLDEPPPPSAHRPDVDPRLEAICQKAMAKKPENRYRSMAELAAAFTEFLKADAAP
ncbi:MAG TPA: serine/threonine-protein kinase, partial [Gemmataceae bacterium]|nr:serine/threonine-protein kinase [Gemmataceae bacterium]